MVPFRNYLAMPTMLIVQLMTVKDGTIQSLMNKSVLKFQHIVCLASWSVKLNCNLRMRQL